MSVAHVLEIIQKEDIAFVDLRFTDTRGKEQHMTISSRSVNEAFFEEGKMFDGSSLAGWKNISVSDMVLLPDPSTAIVDPFFESPTLILRCDVLEPDTMIGYERCPRTLAKKAEAYLKETGIADVCYIGSEPEFFIFKDVRWQLESHKVSVSIDGEDAAWNTSTEYEGGNPGHRPRVKGGYFPVPPVDSAQDLRSAMCHVLEDLGMSVETQHHEVAPCQHEINTRYGNLLAKADELQMLKYVVHNVAHNFGKTATFMPKPFAGDNGSGMHCHMSLAKEGKNIFAGNGYSHLSNDALFFIGGIMKHARALNAFTNPSTNSYKRLVPGFEAPVILAYSACNRSAAIRIPHEKHDIGRRIEVRFPDPSANPYLAFSAMLMAGIDGIKNKINPGQPLDIDLYEASPKELARCKNVAGSLEEALQALYDDMDFLLAGNVFTRDFIDSYAELKQEEITRVRMIPHPVEFDLYYSV